MAQLNWQYYSPTGIPYSIDMYHGDDSGHLMIFVNNEIILINFTQKEARKYNFYIENQLVELDMKKNNNTYEYVLTPQSFMKENPKEKSLDRQFWITLILIFLAVNLFLILIN